PRHKSAQSPEADPPRRGAPPQRARGEREAEDRDRKAEHAPRRVPAGGEAPAAPRAADGEDEGGEEASDRHAKVLGDGLATGVFTAPRKSPQPRGGLAPRRGGPGPRPRGR